MSTSTLRQAYKDAYFSAATHIFLNEFQPVRSAGSFVYDGVGSGAIGATAGEWDVARFAVKEIHYQPRIMNSGSIAFSIEGRQLHTATFTQIDQFSIDTARGTWFTVYTVTEVMDRLRVGVRAASPAASDIVNVFGAFK